MYVVKISLFMQASDGDKVKTLVKYNAKTRTSFFDHTFSGETRLEAKKF